MLVAENNIGPSDIFLTASKVEDFECQHLQIKLKELSFCMSLVHRKPNYFALNKHVTCA